MRPYLFCRHDGTTRAWLLLPGTGPHAGKAVCGECGGFLKWVSQSDVSLYGGFDLKPSEAIT